MIRFGLYLSVHLVWNTLNTWISVSFFRFRKFSAIISLNTFSTFFTLSSLWNLYNVNVSILDVVSEVP